MLTIATAANSGGRSKGATFMVGWCLNLLIVAFGAWALDANGVQGIHGVAKISLVLASALLVIAFMRANGRKPSI